MDALQTLSDDELLHRLAEIVSRSRRVEAELIAHIGEVDERRLYAREACSSMFAYCCEVLHLSEAESYLRIGAARAARQFPRLLILLGEGRLHLSGIATLARHLTAENVESVLARAMHKSKRQIEELVAELDPKPDVAAVMRKLPAPTPELCPERVALRPSSPTPPQPPSRPAPPPKLEPLAPERYKVSFTASSELRDKLQRLQALTGDDLGALIEAAVSEKLERLEAKRYGETKTPRKTAEDIDAWPSSRYVPAPVKRIVSRRDGHQCTFIDRAGRRCTEHRRLELHHDDPYGRGGDHDPSRIRLLCRTHNLFLAERDYGKEVIEGYRRKPDRVSEPAPAFLIN